MNYIYVAITPQGRIIPKAIGTSEETVRSKLTIRYVRMMNVIYLNGEIYCYIRRITWR